MSGFDLGLHVQRGYRRRVQYIELCEDLSEPSSGIVAVALTAGLEEIHEVLDFGSLLWRERVEFLDEHLISACVHGATPQLALEINAPTARSRPQK